VTTFKYSELERDLIDSLAWMVCQHCESSDTSKVNSAFLSADAGAIRLLAQIGVLVDLQDSPGRWCEAKWNGDVMDAISKVVSTKEDLTVTTRTPTIEP
jgi:hypothetical protein